MSILGKTLAALSPGWAASRAKNRMQLMAYEAAMPGRTHKAARESRPADVAVFAAGQSLREQARWLDENHDIVIGILDKFEERVIGANGIQIEPHPRGRDGRIHEAFAVTLAALWAEWSIRPEVTGVHTRPEMERMMLRSALRDGEVFGKLIRGNPPGLDRRSVPLAVEMLEADFVPMNLNGLSGGRQTRSGIELNGWGKPVSYNVYRYYPNGALTMTSGELRNVPAGDMLHLAQRKRLHQVRGISLLHGAIIRLGDIKNYEDSERIAARVAASLGFYIKRGDAMSFVPDDGPTQSTVPGMFDMSPGMIFDGLMPGEDLGMVESNRPNSHLDEFRQGQLRAVAAGTRSGYSSISRDYKGSYSSQRQELVESFEGYSVLQNWFIGQFSRPLYRAFIEMALASGVAIPDDVDRRTLYDAMYAGPVMPWIDPVKEAESWKSLLLGGAATQAEWIRARGRVPQEVIHQRQREVEYNLEQGLIFDSYAGNNMKETTDAKSTNAGRGADVPEGHDDGDAVD